MDQATPVASFAADKLQFRVYRDREEMGRAAASHAAERLRALATSHATVPVIFATGASQLATLRALTSIPGLPWKQVVGFHMDDYIGLAEDHPASFHRYLRENLTSRVPMGKFHAIRGNDVDPEQACRNYAELLRSQRPLLCLLGIGESGHLAFNDPADADFEDPKDVKILSPDAVSRQQQVSEGAFPEVAAMPARAITLTIPALFRVPELILSVPGERKAHIVKRTVEEPISTRCPATILKRHPNATAYLDADSAAELRL